MLKLGILSAGWKRIGLFEMFLKQINRLGLPAVIAVSEQSHERLCKEYNVKSVMTPNSPLGRKFNIGIYQLKEMDYVMILGSDNFLCESTMEVYRYFMDKGKDLIGATDIYFYDKNTARMGYFPGYGELAKTDKRYKVRAGESLGAGRCISKRILEARNYKLWPNSIDRALDWAMMQRIKPILKTQGLFSVKERDVMIVDVKTNININSYNAYKLTPCDTQLMLRIPEWI